MSSRFNRLPLRALTVFEAAARHGRFTAAADELLMTQAAVSQNVAQLEAELGVALFVRRHRGVELTTGGAALLPSVQLGLKTLADSVASARRDTGGKTIQILTDYGFAGFWLMGRLGALSDLLPGVEICVATTQAELERTDAAFDISIMFGTGEWSGFRTDLLFSEAVYPVCTPGYLAAQGLLHQGPPDEAGCAAPAVTPAQVAELRLLHLRGTSGRRWFGWADWFAAHGMALAPGRQELIFDNAQLVLQATLLGQGVSIGWQPIIDDLVASGTLVRLAAEPLRSQRGYFVAEHAGRPYSANVAALKAWLLAARPSQETPTFTLAERSAA